MILTGYYLKKRLQKTLVKVIKIFLKKKKTGCERYINLSGDGKQRLVEYRKSYSGMQKRLLKTKNVNDYRLLHNIKKN